MCMFTAVKHYLLSALLNICKYVYPFRNHKLANKPLYRVLCFKLNTASTVQYVRHFIRGTAYFIVIQ